MASLPIFSTTSTGQVDVPVERLAREVLGEHDFTTQSHGPTSRTQGRSVTVEADGARGGLWASDNDRIWAAAPRDVPDARAVGEIAQSALRSMNVLPQLSGPFRYAKATIAHASTATETGSGTDLKRTVTKGEATYQQGIVLDVSGRDDIKGNELPVFGGGGRFQATVGEQGQVVGMSGVWRGAEQAEERPLRSAEEAIEAAGLAGQKDLRVARTELGYYSAPAFSGQDVLFPVYAVHREVRAGDSWVPARVTLVPATDVGELAPAQVPTPRRGRDFKARLGSVQHQLTPGSALPPGVLLSRKALLEKQVAPEAVLTRGSSGQVFVKHGVDAATLKVLHEALQARSFGTSWIGNLGGLPGSQANAQGFVDELSAEGWQRRFNWGDGAAWKSDWISNDDQYVDAVDMAFYTGHAYEQGWQLGDGWLHHSEIGAQPNVPSDHWGQNNLEWMVIAACGPLQDDTANGGGNAFNRWRGVFDGLHMLLGYAAVSYDNTLEGRRIIQYSRTMPIKQAWFRASREIQPTTNGYGSPNGPTVFASAMWGAGAAGTNEFDYIWGRGPVGPDLRPPTTRYLQMSPC